MQKLANYCNALIDDKKNGYIYALKFEDGVFNFIFSFYVGTHYCFAQFYTEDAMKKAIEIINSNERFTKLAKKWQTGKFEITSKHKGKEIGHINFTISDVPIKNKSKPLTSK